MRIWIESKDGQNLRLGFPAGLALNAGTLAVGRKYLSRYGVSQKQAAAFLHLLNQYRRQHRDWILVEVESANGDYVQIRV